MYGFNDLVKLISPTDNGRAEDAEDAENTESRFADSECTFTARRNDWLHLLSVEKKTGSACYPGCQQ